MKKFKTFQSLNDAWKNKTLVLSKDTSCYQTFFINKSEGNTKFYAWYYVDCYMSDVIKDIEKEFPNATSVSLNYVVLEKNVTESD